MLSDESWAASIIEKQKSKANVHKKTLWDKWIDNQADIIIGTVFILIFVYLIYSGYRSTLKKKEAIEDLPKSIPTINMLDNLALSSEQHIDSLTVY